MIDPKSKYKRFVSLKKKRHRIAKEMEDLKRTMGMVDGPEDGMTEIDGSDEALEVVTDHAVVRYMERVLNIDVDNIRRELVDPRMIDMIKGMSRGVITIKRRNGKFRVRVKNGKIITVLE